MNKVLLIFLFIPSVSRAACDVQTALSALSPQGQWVLSGNTYEGLQWLDSVNPQPTLAQVNAAISACQTQQSQNRLQLQTDIAVIKSTASTTAQQLQAVKDIFQIKGLLQ